MKVLRFFEVILYNKTGHHRNSLDRKNKMDFSFDVDLYKRDVEIIRSYIISLRGERKGRIYLKLDFEKDESFTEMEKTIFVYVFGIKLFLVKLLLVLLV